MSIPDCPSCESTDTEVVDAICNGCSGSGEGMHEGTTCLTCRGSGERWEGYYCNGCEHSWDE